MLAYVHRFHHPFVRLVFLVVLLALIAFAVVSLVRWSRRRHEHVAEPAWPKPAEPPVDPVYTELRAAYARGDLTYDQYAERAANLGYPPPDPPPAPPPSDG